MDITININSGKTTCDKCHFIKEDRLGTGTICGIYGTVLCKNNAKMTYYRCEDCLRNETVNEKQENARKIIFSTIEQSVSNMLYYDRKEDEDCPVDFIENSIKAGYITVDEIIEEISKVLNNSVEE